MAQLNKLIAYNTLTTAQLNAQNFTYTDAQGNLKQTSFGSAGGAIASPRLHGNQFPHGHQASNYLMVTGAKVISTEAIKYTRQQQRHQRGDCGPSRPTRPTTST